MLYFPQGSEHFPATMKSCPQCSATYPDEYAVCPKDGTRLTGSAPWEPDSVIRAKYKIVSKIGEGGTRVPVRLAAIIFLSLAACLVVFMIETRRTAEAEQAHPRAGAAKAAVAKPLAPAASASLQTHRNLGKAYYEQGKYPEAASEFQKVIASGHALSTDHLNLALASMQANDLDAALGELTTAKQMDSKLVAVDYNFGILYKRELRYPDSEAALKRALEADPSDPAAWFNLGTVYFAQRKLEPALDAHQHVVEMGFGRAQNFYVASLFHTFTLLVRLKRKPEADKVLEIHAQVKDRVPNISLQNPALEGGKYGAIVVPVNPPATVGKAPERISFDDVTSKLGISLPVVERPAAGAAPAGIRQSDYSLDYARQNFVPVFPASLAVGDYDGDGRPDLYAVVPGAANHLFHQNADGTFTDVTDKAGVASHGASLSATFADYDNSGHPSLFVAGLGGVTLYHNNGDGTFTDVTDKARLKGAPGELATRAVLFDADADGFLDLVVTAYADLNSPSEVKYVSFPESFAGLAPHFYRNNGDGTFSDVTASAGLAAQRGRWRNAVFADFGNDGYADLLLLRDDGPPLLFRNQGGGKFVDRTAKAGDALAKSQALDAQVADFNRDGSFDLVLWTPSGYEVLLNRGGGKFGAVKSLPAIAPPPDHFAVRGAVGDIDGDGFDDLLVSAHGIWRMFANRAGHFEEVPLKLSPDHWPSSDSLPHGAERIFRVLASLTPVVLGDSGKLDLLGTMPNGQVAVFEKQGPPSRWLEVKLDGYKSNKQGTGTIVELKAGNFYKKVQATGASVRVFIGDLVKLDVVRVTWPNQIVQNSVDVATNQPLLVRESERLASSCPFLYVWDGTEYRFFTDILGVAPIGELQPDGSRIKPHPEELVRLPDKLVDRDGVFTFQITDELREVDYVDQARLLAVDHPATEEVYANEIYSSSPALPALYAVREKHLPVSAVDDHGTDVLPLIRAVDGQYPTDFRRDRILGLADLHSLTLDLGDLPDAGHIALWLEGWVFWTDSNASRALMSNTRQTIIPPYLEVRDEKGRWVTVIPDMGLPSGTNRTMRVDLAGKFLSRDHHVRIVTNLCVYWDQVFFSLDDAPVAASSVAALDERPPSRGTGQAVLAVDHRYGEPQAGEHTLELPLVSADLHYRGFSTPASDPQHLRPDAFDYVNVLAEAPWNPMRGHYTRYGAVEKLLARPDDELVVMATGDELTLKFNGGALAPPRPGSKRDFFLYVRGYAKDGEPNTAFATAVEPLPFGAMSNYPAASEPRPRDAEYRRYLGAYETRPGYLLVPPLRPPVAPVAQK